ncbi:hypothetical protein ACSSS7_002007 [Eimeria intestinalis]
MEHRNGLRGEPFSRPPTLLLLHHLEPPFEWKEVLSVLRSALGQGGVGPPTTSLAFSPLKLQQLLGDIQEALHRGLSKREASTVGSPLRPASGSGGPYGGPPTWGPQADQQRLWGLQARPSSSSSNRAFTRLWSAVPSCARKPFFNRALPLMLEACVAAEDIFPRCRYSSHPAAAAAGAAGGAGAAACDLASTLTPAAAAAAVVAEKAGPVCACGSCRLRLQLSTDCSSGACLINSSSSGSSSLKSSSSSRSNKRDSHRVTCPAELSAAEGWSVAAAALAAAIAAAAAALAAAIAAAAVADAAAAIAACTAAAAAIAAASVDPCDKSLQQQQRQQEQHQQHQQQGHPQPQQQQRQQQELLMSLCSVGVEAFHAKCLTRGLGRFVFAPPHLSAFCCEGTQPEETARALSAMLEEEVDSLLAREAAAAKAAASGPAAAAAAAAGSPAALARQREVPPTDKSCISCPCGTCAITQRGAPTCLIKLPVGVGAPNGAPWPVAFPCCFVLRCLRLSRAQAGDMCSSSETVAQQQGPLLPPVVVEEAVEGGGIPCSEDLDVRADFANAVIGGGVLYHAAAAVSAARAAPAAPAAPAAAVAASAASAGTRRTDAAATELALAGCWASFEASAGIAALAGPAAAAAAAGSLQEEVFFSVSPELLLLRPLSQHLGPGEAAHCWGPLRFSAFKGYARSFSCRGNAKRDNSRGEEDETRVFGPVPKQQQHETHQDHKPHQVSKSSDIRRSLLSVESEDEEGERTSSSKKRPLHAEAAAAAAGAAAVGGGAASAFGSAPSEEWKGWIGEEGVEALDETPLRVQWLFPIPVSGGHSGVAGAQRAEAGPLWLRLEIASIVAALDARQYGHPDATVGAAAAAEILGAVRGLHSSSAAARHVLHPLQQYTPSEMLRELQKWLGSSACGRRMRYFAWGHPALLREALLSRVVGVLLQGPFSWSCGRLWTVLLKGAPAARPAAAAACCCLACPRLSPQRDSAGASGRSPALRSMSVFAYVLYRANAVAPVPDPLSLQAPDAADGTEDTPSSSSSSSSSSSTSASSSSTSSTNSSSSSSRGGRIKRDCELEGGKEALGLEGSREESDGGSSARP